jgi:4-hydroxythreonine-4-phosphate dehydrogenase
MGDACGVGAEVAVKALCEKEVYEFCSPVVIGEPQILTDCLRFVDDEVLVNRIPDIEAANPRHGTIEVLNPIEVDLSAIECGSVCTEAGRAAVEWIKTAVELALANKIDGIVTAPLNKEAMNRAGFNYAGHTELLGHLTDTRNYRMMLVSERLKVIHATTHIALHDVPDRLTEERVFDTIALAQQALVDLDYNRPRIGVAGLNPHAGEHGLFGEEDAIALEPAVERARVQGWDVTGPLPGDTLFYRAFNDDFDGVIAMYHDQGHIPIKLVAFADAVNVTLGLPIIRASVDHGTAFDIAGQGIADHVNMICALRFASRLATARLTR